MPARNLWPLIIVGLIGGFLALTAWSFHRAARGASAVTDGDYYRHGLRFEQTRLERKAAATLGWTAETTLDDRQLRIRLRDQHRQPVTAARAKLALSGSDRGEARLLPLAEEPDGTYVAKLPATLHGEKSARIDFERDGARLSQQLILALP